MAVKLPVVNYDGQLSQIESGDTISVTVINGLATIATTGSYNDLADIPANITAWAGIAPSNKVNIAGDTMTGALGIGVAPTTMLDVQSTNFLQMRLGSAGTTQKLFAGAVHDTVGSFIANNAHYNSSNQYMPIVGNGGVDGKGASGIMFDQNAGIRLWSNTNITTGTAFLPTERLSILTNGNIGIGETNPQNPLVINQRNQTNVYALSINNVGPGVTGIRIANTAGGWLTLGGQTGSAYQIAATNRTIEYSAVGGAYDAAPQSHLFLHDIPSRKVMVVRGATSQSGNIFEVQNVSASNIFSVSPTGNGIFAGTLSASNLSGTNTGDQDLSSLAPKTWTITAGDGLTGGGDLSANRTIALNAASIASLAKADSALQSSNIGSTVQAYSANLTSWSALVPTDKANSGAIGSSLLTMSTAKILGRTTAATGAVEEITIGTGLSLTGGTLSATGGGGGGTVTSVNLANSTGLTASGGPVTGAGSLTYTLSTNLQAWHALATSAKQNTLTSSTSNTISGTQVRRAALTGDVTAAANANATTISNSVVTNAKLANVATARIKGRVSASTGVVEDLTAAQVRTLLNVADGATANTGTVTSVGLSVPTGLQVSGSPVTTSGTLAVTYASGYQGYTSAEATKLGGIAAGATVGATWGTNLASIPANITSWAGIAPSAKQDALGFTPVNKAGDSMTGALTAPVITSTGNLTGSEVYSNNWFRSNTSGTGWYHAVHTGGWYMTDNNWIRNYNGKGLYLHNDSDSQLVLSGSSPTIKFVDTDGGNQWIHNNEGQIGFLQNNTYSWGSYRDPSNNWCSTGNVIAYASDARLKKNVTPVSNSTVDKFFTEFQVEEFDWDYEAIKELNDGFHPSADHEVGAIAQKVEEVLPSMVYTHKHSGIKTLDWDKTIPYLIAEIQSLRKRLTKLERNE